MLKREHIKRRAVPDVKAEKVCHFVFFSSPSLHTTSQLGGNSVTTPSPSPIFFTLEAAYPRGGFYSDIRRDESFFTGVWDVYPERISLPNANP